jgi:hypothetical protein
MSFEERIDIHGHFLPPFYREACEKTGHGEPDGMPAVPVSLALIGNHSIICSRFSRNGV